MPNIKEQDWQKWVDVNNDPYGKCCVDVAREVMHLLDIPEYRDFDCHEIIICAEKNIGESGITGFMAGAVASMVSHCHSRGEEFRKKWNIETQIGNEGERANEKDGAILNPALLNIG